MGGQILLNLVFRGVAHIMDGVMVLLLKERNLEGKDREQLIHIAANLFDAVFLPGPDLRRDIIIHRTDALCLHIFGDAEVKAWIIHENHDVRVPGGDILLTLAHVS